MYKVGDILLYKLKPIEGGIKNVDKYRICTISNKHNTELIFVTDINNDKYMLTKQNIDDMFITLTEHRKSIINDII